MQGMKINTKITFFFR